MKKTILIALVAFAVFISSAWSVMWFVQAQQIKKNIEETIANLDPKYGIIKIQEVTVSGFPTNIVATIINPTADINLATALPALHKQIMAATKNSAGVLTTPSFPDLVMNYKLNGEISFALNSFSDQFYITHKGVSDFFIKDNASNEKVAISTEYNGENNCLIRNNANLGSFANMMWNFNELINTENPFASFEEISCSVSGSVAMNSDNGQIISSTDPLKLEIHNKSTADRIIADLLLDIQGFEMMPEGDLAYNKIDDMISNSSNNRKQQMLNFGMSYYGKQAVLLNSSFEVARTLSDAKKLPTRIEIKQFTYSSAASNSKGNLLFALNPDGEKYNGEFNFDFSSEYNSRQTEIAKNIISQIANELFKPDEIPTQLQNVNRADFELHAFDALPDVSKIGNIIQKINAKFLIDNSSKNADINISSLEFSTRDYGIAGNGNFAMNNQSPIPNSQSDLICRNCLNMVDDIAAYSIRIDRLIGFIWPNDSGKFLINQNIASGVKEILSIVGTRADSSTSSSTNPSNADLKFSIKSSKEGFSVNGKQAVELMMLAEEHLTRE